jgi:hypothetical protein
MARRIGDAFAGYPDVGGPLSQSVQIFLAGTRWHIIFSGCCSESNRS